MKMSMNEKESLFSHLSNLIINRKIFTKVEKVFFIKDIKAAVDLAGKYKRTGKILVTPSNEIFEKYENLH